MIMAKGYKTIAGYLRASTESAEYRLREKRNAKTKEEIVACAHEVRRAAINHLLPQKSISESIADTETPKEGLDRIRATLTDPVKVIDECMNFLRRNPIILGMSVRPVGERVVDGKKVTTFQCNGFYHDDHTKRVCVIVDVEDGIKGIVSAHNAKAEEIGGPGICFHMSSNISANVPDDLKNRLLTYDELYARVPELDYSRKRKRA
jgi:hypothetical protein